MSTSSGFVLEARNPKQDVQGDRGRQRGVSFRISTGGTYGLLGPNGAGKTTTISMVTGLPERNAGVVMLDGQEIFTTSTEPKRAIEVGPLASCWRRTRR